jgi:hypothetical protein
LVEPADQGGERLGLRGWQRPGRLVGDEGGETGEHASIDRIGLRPSRAAASRESAGAVGMHATKRQAELGRDLHQGAHSRQSLRRPWRGSLAARVRLRLRCKTWVMAATVLAIRRARPALSAMSSQSFETSTPMHKGPATAERSVEADRRRAAMGRLSQEGEGPLAQDCNSGWARPTVRAQDRKRQDDGSRLLANSCSIQNRSRRPARHSYRRRKAAKEQPVKTYNPGERRAPHALWIASALRSSR